MVSKDPTVFVVCCIFADGRRIFTLDDPASINTARQKWRESLTAEQQAQHEEHETMGGAVKIKMLAEDWCVLKKEQLCA